MKKEHTISAPLFFILFAIPYAALLYLILQQQYVRFKMEERIEEENLQTVVVLASDIRWIDYPEEAMIGNRLFDIKESHTEGTEVILKGLFDDEETRLVDHLIQLAQQKEGKTDPQLDRFFQLLNSVFYQAPYEANHWQNKMTLSHPDSYCSILPKLFLKVPTPPPQLS